MAESVILAALILLLVVLVAFILMSFLLITLYIAYVHRQYNHLPGPPYHSFYTGHFPELRKAGENGGYHGDQIVIWGEQYSPFYRMFIFHRCLIWVTDAAVVKDILTKSKYPKAKAVYSRLGYVCGKRFLGHGLLSEFDHHIWYKRRATVNPAFHKRHLLMFLEQFNRVGDRWISSLESLADGKTMFSMHDYMCRVTLDAIAEVGFNNCLNAVERKDNTFLVAILTCLQAISKKVKNPVFELLPNDRQFKNSVQMSIEFLRQHGQKLLDERVAQMQAGEPVPEDMLTYIIKCRETDPSLTDEDLLDDFMTLFVAGQETTSNALSFLFCEIGRNPDVLLRLQEEIDSVMGSRTYVEYDDLGKLEYCGQVFKEALRLYLPAPGTMRENVEEMFVQGHRVPYHSMIACNFYLMHHLSKYYPDPFEFRPERFGQTSERPPLFSYLPFSLGQRSCVGRQFANIEAKVLISKFFQKFSFKLDMDQPFGIMETATIRPQSNVRMTLSLR